METLGSLFAVGDLLPHGYCIAWSPGLLWSLVSADALIAASYYSIPIGLYVIAKRRTDLAFHWMFRLFALFIFACGTTHLIGVANIWYPLYRLDAAFKVLTAVTSAVTAAMLWPLIPKVLAIPSPAQIAEANRRLEMEIDHRRRAEEALRIANAGLERRVSERTAELQRTNEQLARSNADLEQFAYVASHDLQEPLRMVSAYGRLLERRHADQLDGDAREFLGFMIDGAHRMQSMIDDLLELSRASRGVELAPVPLDTALDRALDNLSLAIEESGAILHREPLPVVMGDDNQLARLFQNLLSNAMKFRGGDAPQIRVTAVAAASEWVVSIADTGIGLDPAHAERIFLAFQRLHDKGEYPGTGIGLSVCKRIVERHGGRIWVESSPGRGAVFSFSIPREGQP